MLKGYHEFKYSCCEAGCANYEAAKLVRGCTKGKHHSQHHTDYHYSSYVFYMQEQVRDGLPFFVVVICARRGNVLQVCGLFM